MGQRHEQALSTFTRLDLAEPGFAAWLRRTLKHREDAKSAIEGSSTLKVAILARGPIDRRALRAELRSAFEQSGLGFELAFVAPDDADYLLKVATENLTRPGQKPAVGIKATDPARRWRAGFHFAERPRLRPGRLGHRAPVVVSK